MIEPISDTPDFLVAFRLGGHIDAEDIEHFMGRVEDAFDAHEQVSLFMEIEALEGMSPQAVLMDVQKGLSQLKNLRRLHRVAVVAQQEWIRTGVEWENRIFSGIDLRAFEPAGRTEALAWASETPPRLGKGPERGLREISTTDPGTLAFALTGPVTGADIEAIAPRLRTAYDRHGSVNLLMRMEASYRFRLDVFSKQLADLKTDALAHVERYALVGASDWVETATEWAQPLLKMDVRFFDRDDEDAAWDWLGSAPHEPPAGRLGESAPA